MAASPVVLPLLHRFLGIGLMILAAVFLVLRFVGIAPLVPADEASPVIAWWMSGAAALLVAAAVLLLKPRVPERPLGQSIENYWSTPEVAARVTPVWFLMEGAGILAAVGYLMTGAPVAVTATGAAILAFWWCGPALFAKP